jgi:hypothetical protein
VIWRVVKPKPQPAQQAPPAPPAPERR